MCERVCKVTLSPWQMRTTRPDPNATCGCKETSELVKLIVPGMLTRNAGKRKGSRKNPIGRTAKRSNHKQPSTDDRRATRARDGCTDLRRTRTHTDHGPLRPDGGPGVSVTLDCYPFRLWQASLSSFAYEHSLEQPRRVGVARRCQRAVSYTHLTLPTKRIV